MCIDFVFIILFYSDSLVAGELSPVCAIVGGILGQEVIKVTSPFLYPLYSCLAGILVWVVSINNYFCSSLPSLLTRHFVKIVFLLFNSPK